VTIERIVNDAKAKLGATAVLLSLTMALTWMVWGMREDMESISVSLAQAHSMISNEADKVRALDDRMLRVEQRLQAHIEESGPRLADWKRVFSAWVTWMETTQQQPRTRR
jgi:hypothetical protein